MPKSAVDIFKEKLKFLLKAESRLVKAVTAHQLELYTLILTEYMPLFEVVDGTILDNDANALLINKLDKVFDKLEKALYRDVLGPMATDLLKGVQLNAQYFIKLGFEKTIVNKLLKDKINLEKRLGITPTGRLRKTSYLYNLGKTAGARQTLKNYVVTNLTGDTPFLDFQLGFRNLVIGNKKVKGVGTTGVLQKYFDQYAVDAFAQTDAITDKQFANELGLEHFIYEGSLIKTSRAFCVKRAGKPFKVSETKTWKDDPTLIDQKTKDAYGL